MDELEEIKKRRLEEIKRKHAIMQQQMQEETHLQEQVAQLEDLVKPYFTKEALSRYGNLRVAHPDKAVQVLVLLAQAIQAKQIKQQIDDNAFKELLKRMSPQKREIKINK